MKIVDLYGKGTFGLSFEIFPPKTEAGESQLFDALEALMVYRRPSFVSCTYGAAGSTQDKTLELTAKISKTFGITTAAHRTCVGSTVEEIRQWLKEATNAGIENIVALRGDPPKGQAEFNKPEGGFAHANELVALIRREFPHVSIAVAGYPETHQEAPSPEVDLVNLKRKVEAGADAVITQLFYDNHDFFTFRRRYEEAGIAAPLIPGILPVVNLGQVQRITSMCRARIPVSFLTELEVYRDDPDGQVGVGIRYAIRQCRELLDAGIPGLHFYLLNKSEATFQILQALKLSG
ncbi:methylenetetrahydrofolate reductase [NAD(P)H] [Candidatus Methylomirabilis sp.]|uniref:Methylenetetrahydrofolate reductase n=1 Tax=Candidatus Methylomirabilis tolerans TaxID=3123416 RepID=A0AAJ1AH49_9BACT|nr:methylenetetrahydrofolate reductase [NAD(P)H] [Candidatus Methylomirabilis sp.]